MIGKKHWTEQHKRTKWERERNRQSVCVCNRRNENYYYCDKCIAQMFYLVFTRFYQSMSLLSFSIETESKKNTSTKRMEHTIEFWCCLIIDRIWSCCVLSRFLSRSFFIALAPHFVLFASPVVKIHKYHEPTCLQCVRVYFIQTL